MLRALTDPCSTVSVLNLVVQVDTPSFLSFLSFLPEEEGTRCPKEVSPSPDQGPGQASEGEPRLTESSSAQAESGTGKREGFVHVSTHRITVDATVGQCIGDLNDLTHND